MNFDLTSRLALLSVVALLMAQAKGIHVIPTDDDPPPPPPAAVTAEQAYREGVAAHEKGLALAADVPTTKARDNKRKQRRIQRHYEIAQHRFDEALEYATQTEPTPTYTYDIYRRTADMLLYADDIDGARAAVSSALAIRPEDLPSLHTLALMQAAEADWQSVQHTYTKVWQEAEVRAEAWDYVDKLIAHLDKQTGNMPDATRQWYAEAKDLAENSVRWSTLPDN